MEIPRFANKENLFELKVCQMASSITPPPHLLSAPQTMLKKPQTKTKAQKSFAANVRAGDWVCLRCKNLNFAFRSECNRCQLQIKDQNKYQTYYPSENSSPKGTSQKRAPLKDLTNLKGSPSNQSSFEILPNQDKPVIIERDSNIKNLTPQIVSVKTIQAPVLDNMRVDPNKGFNNVILVTPPKRNQLKNFNFLQEDFDFNQVELPPYKSPKCLPSITSMLEQVTGDQYPSIVYRKSLYYVEERTRRNEEIGFDNGQSEYNLIKNSNFFCFENYESKSEDDELNNHQRERKEHGLGNHD